MSEHLTDDSYPASIITTFIDSDPRSLRNRRAQIVDGVDGLLMEGVLSDDLERVKEALARGADPMVREAWPLQTATEANNMRMLRLLLPLTDVAATGHRAFLYAATFGRYPAVLSLLATRADQASLDLALCSAVVSTSLRCCAALIEAGANPKAHASRALALALLHGSRSVAEMLFPLSDPRSWMEGDMTIDSGHPWGALRLVATQAPAEFLERVLGVAVPPMEVLRGILSSHDPDGASEEARHVIMAHISLREAELLQDSVDGGHGHRPPARRV